MAVFLQGFIIQFVTFLVLNIQVIFGCQIFAETDFLEALAAR